MAIKAPDVAIDLGTTNTMYYVCRKGIVINEPTLVVAETKDRRLVRAVGDEARYLLGRTKDTMTAIRPIKDGIIADFDAAEVMLRYFMRKAIGSSHLIKPRVLVSIPTSLDNVSRKAVREAVTMAGAKEVIFVEKPLAAAIGSGLPVYDPIGSMVVDVGGGTTDTAVISLGGVVVAQSIKVGGERIDGAVIDYLKKNSSVLISDQTAEDLKKDLACATPVSGANTAAHVRGFDLLAARVMDVEFTAAQAHDAVIEPCMAIIASIRWVLERTPPELSADVMRSGIHLTGAASQLLGLDKLIATQLGIPVLMAREPGDATIMGLGYLVENPDLLAGVARSSVNQK